jgi:tetratricopeptide (TPR) repeat protein
VDLLFLRSDLEAQGKQETIEYAIALNNQAMLFYSLGRIQEAHDVNVQAGLVASYTLNTTDKDYFPFMVNKALIMREMGELVAAESILTDVKTRKEKKLGKKRPEYARAINHLSAIRLEMGKLEEVEEMQAHALKIYNKEFGQNHPATAKIYYNQAVFYIHQNRYPEAVEAGQAHSRIYAREIPQRLPRNPFAFGQCIRLDGKSFGRLRRIGKAERCDSRTGRTILSCHERSRANQVLVKLSELRLKLLWFPFEVYRSDLADFHARNPLGYQGNTPSKCQEAQGGHHEFGRFHAHQ